MRNGTGGPDIGAPGPGGAPPRHAPRRRTATGARRVYHAVTYLYSSRFGVPLGLPLITPVVDALIR